MNPITTLTIGHIGKKVRIVDDGITLAGPLQAIDAEREMIHQRTMGGEEAISPGAWANITVTVGMNRIDLYSSAQWEPV